jgi:hypothetical protein
MEDDEEVEVEEDDDVRTPLSIMAVCANTIQDDFNIITEAPADAPAPEA